MTLCAQGYGYTPEEVVPLGSLPALRQLHLMDCLEGDPGPYTSRASRFVESASLQSLQVRPAPLCLLCCPCHDAPRMLPACTLVLGSISSCRRQRCTSQATCQQC